MLFELNDNNNYNYDINLDYFNLDKMNIMNNYNNLNYSKKNYDKNNNLELENGFYKGNIYSNTYKPYKNYKSKKINAYSEQQKMLLRIMELDFFINDLNLYLDINPNDMSMFEVFKKCTMELDNLKKKYYEKYQVLELCKDDKNKYTWINNPWPWDGGYYV